MGDRANIKLKARGHNIYIYTHWEGSEWPSKLQDAMKKGRERWKDPQYLQRFLITEVCRHHDDDASGYGVSCWRDDNSHDVMEVDFDAQMVRELSCEGWHERETEWEALPPKVLKEWSFADFSAATLTPSDDE
jgi:hypothetical protein